jgi:hypothetical protein
MRTLLLAATAIPAMMLATPAAAQYNRSNVNAYGDTAFTQRIDQLGSRITAGVRAGTINRYEARQVRQEYRNLLRLHGQYRVGGLTRGERDVLRDRIRDLRADVRIADNGSWDRYDRYAFNDPYWGGGYYGRGGPDEDDDGVCIRRGNIGGLIERLFENDDDCLRVGERARSQLLPVPTNYRSRYRDRGDVYFRSDGERIYEIDVRSNRVIDVHPM